jgi:HTH-type transcriptional regulator/antitoxin HigA
MNLGLTPQALCFHLLRRFCRLAPCLRTGYRPVATFAPIVIQGTSGDDSQARLPALMQNLDVSKTTAAWSSLAGKIHVPHSEAEYQQLVALLDSMIDEVGEDESHPLASLMEIVGVLIEKYEDEHVPELAVE